MTNADSPERQLARLTQTNAIQKRDETLFRYLSYTRVLSRQQIHRLLWPASKEAAARKRLDKLMNAYGLIANFHCPKADMLAHGLAYRKIYTLTPLSRLWLAKKMNTNPGPLPNKNRPIHDLLLAEILTRITESFRRPIGDFRFNWRGAHNDKPLPLSPDGLITFHKRERDNAPLSAYFIEVDTGRANYLPPNSRMGKKIDAYNRLFNDNWQKNPALTALPHFPAVLFITHNKKRLKIISNLILKRRHSNAVFGVALFGDLFAAGDFLAAPAWRIIKNAPKGKTQKREDKQPLRAVGEASRQALKAQRQPAPANIKITPPSPAPAKSAAPLKPPSPPASSPAPAKRNFPKSPQEKERSSPPAPQPPRIEVAAPPAGDKTPLTNLVSRSLNRRKHRTPLDAAKQQLNSFVKEKGAGYTFEWITSLGGIAQVFGLRKTHPALPAGLAIIKRKSLAINAFFMELDQGAAWVGRYLFYQHLFNASWDAIPELRDIQHILPAVLILTPANETRLQELIKNIIRERNKPTRFYLTYQDDFMAEGRSLNDPVYFAVFQSDREMNQNHRRRTRLFL